jgi:dienelactone hydrolase
MLPRPLKIMAALTFGAAIAGLSASVTGNQAQPPQGANAQKGSGEGAAKEALFAPMVKIQDEDYSKVRSQFRTKLTRKGASPQPWSAAKPPAGVSEIEYVSGELRLKAWVNRPAVADPKRPAVLFLHGGFAFDAPDDWDVSQSYRDAGFIVLTPMLRAENGQAGAFSFYYDEVDDVLAAAEYLRKQPYVDADRLYLAGPSAGGTLALLAAMTSKHFRAAAAFSAMPDQVLFCKHAKRASRDVPVDITNLKELQVRSPLAYAASLKCPTRIFYGSKEPHLFAASQLTAKTAKGKELDVEAVQVEGDHSTSVPPGIKQSIEFFRKTWTKK